MRKRTAFGKIVLGMCLACVIMFGTEVMGAWREDVSITWLRVTRIKCLGVADSTIYVDDPVSFVDGISISGDLDMLENNVTNVGQVTCDSIIADASALAIGDGSETIAIDSTGWSITATGVGTEFVSVAFTNSAIIAAIDADTIRVTETTIDLVGDTLLDTVTTSGDVDNDATGGSTGDPDFGVDGYAHLYGTAEVDGTLKADGTLDANGIVALGDGGDNFSVASDGLDISTAGAITECDGLTFTNAAAFVPVDADTVRLTETTMDFVGAMTVDGVTASGSVTVNGASVLGDSATTVTNMAKIYAITSFEGPVGAVDPAAGAFTTVGASQDITANGDVLGDAATIVTNMASVWGGEVAADEKYCVVGGDATTGLMIQKGDGAAVTNGATVTFPTVFGATPTVVLGADESTTTVPYPSSVTPSNFVVNGEAAKTQNWIAVGTRP